MGQRFVACDREQSFLMPPDVREWLPENHLAWFVIDAVGEPVRYLGHSYGALIGMEALQQVLDAALRSQASGGWVPGCGGSQPTGASSLMPPAPRRETIS